MRQDFLDRFSRLESPIHALPPLLKLAVSLLLIVTVVATPVHFRPVFVGVLALLVLAAATSRVPISFLAGRVLLLEPFVASVALLSAFQPGGLSVALAIALRSTLCLSVIVLLTSTTPFSRLLEAIRLLRMPSVLLAVLALLYRYLFVIGGEAERMKRARASRTFTRGRAWTWTSLASLAGQLFVRSTERAERIYAAMGARGWQ